MREGWVLAAGVRWTFLRRGNARIFSRTRNWRWLAASPTEIAAWPPGRLRAGEESWGGGLHARCASPAAAVASGMSSGGFATSCVGM
ncbi:hypothetical protein T484DRAFT_1956963, partial [Baffinella frigidus]